VIPPAFIILAGLLLVPLFHGTARKIWVTGIGAGGVVAAVLAVPGTSAWSFTLAPGIELVLFSVDPVRFYAGVVFAGAALLAILYALFRDLPAAETMGILASAGAALGIVYAGDFITIFIFWELLALASLLIIWSAPGSGGSGFRYLLYHIFGGACLLAGCAITVGASGSTLIGPVGPGPGFLLLAIGIGVNAAFIPLHTWVPDAYPRASITGSVALSIFTTKAAVFLFVVIGGWGQAVAWMGAFMAIYGAVFALLQDDIRRLLSYSVISQVGYMVAAIGVGTVAGIDAALAHMANDILFKALLFMAAGAVIYRTGTSRLSRLGGLARTMPLTAVAAVIGGFALAGLPGLNGSVSKAMVIEAAAGIPYMALLLIFAAVITVLYVVRLLYFVFFRTAPTSLYERGQDEAPVAMLAAMAVTAGCCLLFGLFPDLLTALLPGGTYAHPFSRAYLTESAAVFLSAALLFLLIRPLRFPGWSFEADIDRVYCATGHALAWFAIYPLSAVSGSVNQIVSRITFLVTWISRNPVMAIRIGGRTFALPVVRALSDPASTDAYVAALTGMRERYPDEKMGIRGSGYGLILVSIIAFLYYLYDVLK
jgi:formate hydrogenlyase subunit 3/multisubunit Na+/H+ antiporter MnhD subunit